MDEQYKKAKEILIEELDKIWINSAIRSYRGHIKKIQRKYGKYAIFHEREDEYHLFAKWWLDTSPFGIVRIIMIANLLKTLKNCKGFEKKIQKLKTSPKEFEKLIYEFRIAYNFIQFGWDVIFPETPDLIVLQQDFTYYVECKKKDIYGGRERETKNIFKSVSERAIRKWKNIKAPFIIFVNCKTSIESKDRPHFKKIVENIITRPEEEINFSDEKFEIVAKNPKTENQIIEVPSIDYPMNTEEEINQRFIYSLTTAVLGFPINPDHYTFEGDINFQNDRFLLHNVKFIGFVSKESLDRFKSIENNFKEALGQIPKEGNGLIYIELDLKIYPYEVKTISERLEGKLKNHPRINAVLLTREITEKPTDEDLIKGTHYVKLLNKEFSPPEHLKIPGIKGEEIKDVEKRFILEDLVRKYTPDGFRPFNKEGSTLIFSFKPRYQNKIQYYIDIGNESTKNRISLFHDGKSKLVLRIYSFNDKCYSIEAPTNEKEFFDKDHVVLCIWVPLKGYIEINIGKKKYRKNVDTFYLEDMTVKMLIGTDITKKYFAKMLGYSVQLYARPFSDKEIHASLLLPNTSVNKV